MCFKSCDTRLCLHANLSMLVFRFFFLLLFFNEIKTICILSNKRDKSHKITNRRSVIFLIFNQYVVCVCVSQKNIICKTFEEIFIYCIFIFPCYFQIKANAVIMASGKKKYKKIYFLFLFFVMKCKCNRQQSDPKPCSCYFFFMTSKQPLRYPLLLVDGKTKYRGYKNNNKIKKQKQNIEKRKQTKQHGLSCVVQCSMRPCFTIETTQTEDRPK